MITFRKKNDVYLEFSSDDKGELRMLSEYFSYHPEGYQFVPSYRNKFWDGYIRMANLKNNTIYCGLAEEIAKFAEDLDVEVEFAGSKHHIPGIDQDVPEELLGGFLKALDPHSRGERIEMRDYQEEAFRTAVAKQRCLLVSPTASGKSLIIYSLIRWWREVHDRKILIVVPSISLVSQLISDFKDYSNGGFDDVHGITAGVVKDTDKRVIVTTWQSVFKQPIGWFAQFGSVVVDEVHHATAKSLQGIMEKLLICPDRVGLTGTLKDCKTHQLTLKGLFGPSRKMISTKELMDRDQISQMSVQIVHLEYPEEDKKIVRKMDYNDEIEYIFRHEKRNRIIAKMASTLPGNTLVIFGRLDHGKWLFDNIDAENKQKFYIAGSTDKDSREAARVFAEENDVVIVASLGVFSTGVNIKNLHNLVFAHPTKSKIKVLQSIGRVLRKAKDEKPAKVYDIVDDLKHGNRDNFALRHAHERFKQYTIENFEWKVNKIKL